MKKTLLLPLRLTAALALTGAALLPSVQAQSAQAQSPLAQSAGTPGTTLPTPAQAAQVNERLIRNMYGPGADVQFIYGAVPDSLPLRLDPRLNVIASIRTAQNGGAFIMHRLMVSSDLNAEAALSALRASLEASGWTMRPVYGMPTGFATGQTNRNSSFYRQGTPNYMLDANATERNGRTDLDLNVNVVTAQAIASFKKAPSAQAQSSLPLLKPMPGASVKGTGYAPTFPMGSMSSARVVTERSANEVFAFYSAQLKAAGWKARTDTTDGPLRVVTYSLKDVNGREALGTLGIRPWEKEGGGYVLTVSAQSFKP